MAQWLGVRLPVQGTRVRALVREDSHMPRSNQAREPQLLSLRSRAREPQLLSPHATTTEAAHLEPVLRNKEKPPQKSSSGSPQLEKAPVQQRGPNAAKNK